jgi:hypothetical protein
MYELAIERRSGGGNYCSLRSLLPEFRGWDSKRRSFFVL